MKQKLLTLFLALIASVGTMFAEGVQIGDLNYILNSTDRTATVTYKYSWSHMPDHNFGISSVVVPATVTYNDVIYDVTSIGYSALAYYTDITSVTLPNSITTIEDAAFAQCSGLISINIPNSVTSIGEYAFSECKALTGITLPNSITSIRSFTFYACLNLTSIDIPNNVTNIGECAFQSCTSLTNITIGSRVKSIRRQAFQNCRSLVSVDFPNSLNTIDYQAFQECSALTNISFGDSITKIGTSAFYRCSSLTSVTIPNSVTDLQPSAFGSCTGLASVTIGSGISSIGDYIFNYCTNLTNISMGNNIRSINKGAFSACNRLETILLPDSLTNIGEDAFKGSLRLKSVIIPSNVKNIGKSAFVSCVYPITMESDIPPTVEENAFGTTTIYVPCGSIETYKNAWPELINQINYAPTQYELQISSGIGGSVNSSYITICDNRGQIEATPEPYYHFVQWNDGNTENPRTITLTQDTSFAAEFALDRSGSCGENLVLVWTYDDENKALTITGEGALTSNYKFGLEAPIAVEKLIISEGVTAVGARAFADYSTLKHISVAASVKTIYEQAFYNCIGLEEIFSYRATPSTAYSNSFDGIDKFNCTLHVLSASVDMYKAATGWRDFYYIQTIDASEVTDPVVNVTVIPTENTALFTWPIDNNAASYSLEITKDNIVFCTLSFNAYGQLTNIAFAPSRKGQPHAQSATQTANGMQFTVTGLNGASKYAYHLSVTDESQNEIQAYRGEFATVGYEGEVNPGGEPEINTEGFEDALYTEKATKILINNVIYILRGDKVYTVTGQEVR